MPHEGSEPTHGEAGHAEGLRQRVRQPAVHDLGHCQDVLELGREGLHTMGPIISPMGPIIGQGFRWGLPKPTKTPAEWRRKEGSKAEGLSPSLGSRQLKTGGEVRGCPSVSCAAGSQGPFVTL